MRAGAMTVRKQTAAYKYRWLADRWFIDQNLAGLPCQAALATRITKTWEF